LIAGLDPLDQAQAAFELLLAGPAPLAVDGRAIGHRLPARLIRLDELKSLLLHPSVSPATRDAAWVDLVRRARTDGPAWVVGAVGVAMPGLRRAAGRLCRGGPRRWAPDIEGEILTGFLHALHTIDLDGQGVAGRLCWAAYRAGYRARPPWWEVPVGVGGISALLDRSADPFELLAGIDGQRTGQALEPQDLLDQAVVEKVITVAAARLIARTRLDRVPLKVAAAELGMSYTAARARRQRAEQRLAVAFTGHRMGRRR
jgi:hypothetical protein